MWPQEDLTYDEGEIYKEKKKGIVTIISLTSDEWHLGYFSRYTKTVRMAAWIFRFVHNTRSSQKKRGSISVKEFDYAELFVL